MFQKLGCCSGLPLLNYNFAVTSKELPWTATPSLAPQDSQPFGIIDGFSDDQASAKSLLYHSNLAFVDRGKPYYPSFQEKK